MQMYLHFQHAKDGGQSVLTKLKCAAGLADLATKKYKSDYHTITTKCIHIQNFIWI
jgi:hypothetical protein